MDQNFVLFVILSLTGSTVFLSILGAHLLFNMKEALGERGLNQGTSYNSKSTVSGIDFAISPQASVSGSQEEMVEPETIEWEGIC